MPVDMEEPLKAKAEELEQEFAQFIDNIPASGFIDESMVSNRLKRKNISPLVILDKHARPSWQKPKKATIEQLEVQHTDTSKNLKFMRERYKNISPCLAHFGGLDECSSEQRREAAVKLVCHLKAVATNDKDLVDEEHDVTEYCAKRLLRGCCRREGGTRLGSALALALMMKECPSLEVSWIMALAKKILVSPKRTSEKDVAWGKAMFLAVLVVSGRAFDKENCGRVVQALTDLRKFPQVRQFITQLIGYLITKCPASVVVSQIWSRLKQALTDPTSYTPELFYLALKLQGTFQGSDKLIPDDLRELVEKDFCDKILLKNMQQWVTTHLFDYHPQVHILWQALVTTVFTSSDKPKVVANNFKTMWKTFLEETFDFPINRYCILHVQTEIALPVIASVETIEDEVIRNDLLYFIYLSKPPLLNRGLLKLGKTKETPAQPVDNLIRQFWNVVELGPEDPDFVLSQEEQDDDDLENMSGMEDEDWAWKIKGSFTEKPSGPAERKFSSFRTVVQRYIIRALKIHVNEDPSCMQQVFDFCMNIGLFYVPSDVSRCEVLRLGDLRRVITVELYDMLLGLLQAHTGFKPRFMYDAMTLLLDKEQAYQSRYEPLSEDSPLLEARNAIVKVSKQLQQLFPEEWERPGVHTAHQAFSRLLGYAFFYVSVIQDEGVPDLLLDLCKYCEDHMQDLTGDMDSLIDLILALMTYQVDFDVRIYNAAHNFRLIQQAALSLFRKTCVHLTRNGLCQIMEALEDPMKVVDISDTNALDVHGDEEEEDAAEKGQNQGEDEEENGGEEEDKNAAEEGQKEEEEEEDEDEEEEDEEEEEEEKEEGKEGDGPDAEEENVEGNEGDSKPQDDSEDSGSESDADLMDMGMDMDIDESQMAMVLKAHQMVAERRKAKEEKALRERSIITNVRLKMLDLVSLYITMCDQSGTVLEMVHPLLKLLVQEQKYLEGSKKEQEKMKKKKRYDLKKNADMYTKLRAILRLLLKSKPKPEKGDEEKYTKTCYDVLAFCADIISGRNIGLEGPALKSDFLACSVWITANFLHGLHGKEKVYDERRIRGCFFKMFYSKDISMRIERLMEEMLQRYLQRFGLIYVKYIIPALCEALVSKVTEQQLGHPHTKVVLLKCLDTTLQYVLPKSVYQGSSHISMLKQLSRVMKVADQLDLNDVGVELLINVTYYSIKYDRQYTLWDAAVALWNKYKDMPSPPPRTKLNLKHLGQMLKQTDFDGLFAKKKKKKAEKENEDQDAEKSKRRKKEDAIDEQNSDISDSEPKKKKKKKKQTGEASKEDRARTAQGRVRRSSWAERTPAGPYLETRKKKKKTKVPPADINDGADQSP